MKILKIYEYNNSFDPRDKDNLLGISENLLNDNKGILIFCPSKILCETTSYNLAQIINEK